MKSIKIINRKHQRLSAAVVVAVVTVVGVAAVFYSHAAGPLAGFEPENGTLSGPAVAVSNAAASNGKVLQFVDPSAPWPHAPLPSGTSHTATPTITFDTTAAPSLAPWVNNTLKPILLSWYPVIADFYAYPSYAVPSNITIDFDLTSGIAGTNASSAHTSANPTWVAANEGEAPGMFLHELTHDIQQSIAPYPGWIIEGQADYTREHIYDDRVPQASLATETYVNGYSAAANLLARAEALKPGFMHTLAASGQSATYSDGLFVQNTGETIEQLWKDASGHTVTKLGTFKNVASSKCIGLPNGDTTTGLRIDMETCSTADPQKWIGQDVTTTGGIIEATHGLKCIDVQHSGTAASTPVWYYDCNAGLPQTWIYRSDKTLYNPNSQKCLQPVGGATATGTLLEIAACTTSNAQKWTLP